MAVSVMAPKYSKGAKPVWHFVDRTQSRRAVCGALVSARVQGTRPIRKIDCPTCAPIMWNWAVRQVLHELAGESAA